MEKKVVKHPRPVEVHSNDYVLHQYGVSEKQAERAYKSIKPEVKAARSNGQSRTFTGKL